MVNNDNAKPFWKIPAVLISFIVGILVLATLAFGYLHVFTQLPVWTCVLLGLPSGVLVFAFFFWLAGWSERPAAPRSSIKGCLLIESPTSENDEEFRAYVNELLTSAYGKIPDWLQFNIGQRIRWRDAQFREFICVAGSVSAQLMLQARRPGGISRAIIVYGVSLDGKPLSDEIRNGVETKFNASDLRVV